MSCYREREAAGVGVTREVSCGFGAGVKQAMAAAKTTANPISIRMFFFIIGISDNSQSACKRIHFSVSLSASLVTSFPQPSSHLFQRRCAMRECCALFQDGSDSLGLIFNKTDL